MWESFGTNYFFHLADSYHRCKSPPAQRGAKWEMKTHSHSAAVWVRPSTPSAPCNSPKLPFNKENMDLISGFDVGQTVAAHFHLTGGAPISIQKRKKKKKMSDKSRAELLGWGEGLQRRKLPPLSQIRPGRMGCRISSRSSFAWSH